MEEIHTLNRNHSAQNVSSPEKLKGLFQCWVCAFPPLMSHIVSECHQIIVKCGLHICAHSHIILDDHANVTKLASYDGVPLSFRTVCRYYAPTSSRLDQGARNARFHHIYLWAGHAIGALEVDKHFHAAVHSTQGLGTRPEAPTGAQRK